MFLLPRICHSRSPPQGIAPRGWQGRLAGCSREDPFCLKSIVRLPMTVGSVVQPWRWLSPERGTECCTFLRVKCHTQNFSFWFFLCADLPCLPSLQLSPTIISGLHNIVKSIETRNYQEGLNIHTHIVSTSNFSETSAFMPVLKVVLTQANKLGVWGSPALAKPWWLLSQRSAFLRQTCGKWTKSSSSRHGAVELANGITLSLQSTLF